MAYNFVLASSQYLEIDIAPITSVPITMAARYKTDSLVDYQSLACLSDSTVTNNALRLVLAGDEAGDYLQAVMYAGATYTGAKSSIAYSTGVWQSAVAVYASSTSRTIYLNGANKGVDTNPATATGLNRLSIGRLGDSTPGGYMSGAIDDVALWDVALTDAEAAQYAAGVSPLFIRPGHLVAYFRLLDSVVVDMIGGLTLTAFNSPTVVASEPVFMPSAQILQFSAGGGGRIMGSLAGLGGLAGPGGLAGQGGGLSG